MNDIFNVLTALISYVFLTLFKVACTNWKRTLLYLSGGTNVTKPMDIPADFVHRTGVLPKLSNFSAETATQMLQTYTTFLIVRHPFERLLSAYRNKLEQHSPSSKYFQTRFGKHIGKLLLSEQLKVSVKCS